MENPELNTAEGLALLQDFWVPFRFQKRKIDLVPEVSFLCVSGKQGCTCQGLGEDTLAQLVRGSSWTGCSLRPSPSPRERSMVWAGGGVLLWLKALLFLLSKSRWPRPGRRGLRSGNRAPFLHTPWGGLTGLGEEAACHCSVSE